MKADKAEGVEKPSLEAVGRVCHQLGTNLREDAMQTLAVGLWISHLSKEIGEVLWRTLDDVSHLVFGLAVLCHDEAILSGQRLRSKNLEVKLKQGGHLLHDRFVAIPAAAENMWQTKWLVLGLEALYHGRALLHRFGLCHGFHLLQKSLSQGPLRIFLHGLLRMHLGLLSDLSGTIGFHGLALPAPGLLQIRNRRKSLRSASFGKELGPPNPLVCRLNSFQGSWVQVGFKLFQRS